MLVFPKEAATGGQLSLPGGNICVPLLASQQVWGGFEPRMQAPGWGPQHGSSLCVSQSTKAAAMSRVIFRENRSLWPDTASIV